jgi:hypothetical protein
VGEYAHPTKASRKNGHAPEDARAPRPFIPRAF